jgi:hypothetical protein
MNWGRRFRLYFFGFGIGLLICWLLFFRNGNRDITGWTPESRVLKFISLSKQLDADSTTLCKLKCEGISIADIRKGCETADVDFSKSQTGKEPCREYDVKMTLKGKPMELYFSACMADSTAKLLYINPPLSGEACGCK